MAQSSLRDLVCIAQANPALACWPIFRQTCPKLTADWHDINVRSRLVPGSRPVNQYWVPRVPILGPGISRISMDRVVARDLRNPTSENPELGHPRLVDGGDSKTKSSWMPLIWTGLIFRPSLRDLTTKFSRAYWRRGTPTDETVLDCAPAAFDSTWTCTRRFWARPARVLLLATS